MDGDPRDALGRQAYICRRIGSPFTAGVLDAAARVLDDGSATGRTILQWEGDPDRAALALRLAGGLHALARRGTVRRLTDLYDDRPSDADADADAAIVAAIAVSDVWLAGWLRTPPQTNEIGRGAAVMAALMTVAAKHPGPIELLELGSSAGLNLALDSYAFDLGGVAAGDPCSTIRIRPEWRGAAPIAAPPIAAPIVIASRRGVDVDPLNPADPDTVERLTAFVWPDRPDRLVRLEAALALARVRPPPVERGDAAEWVEARLAEPRFPGTTRVVFHTIVLQYLTADARSRVTAAIKAAGRAADADRPLAWIAFEWDWRRELVDLTLRLWPGGDERRLATAHPHADWIDWTG